MALTTSNTEKNFGGYWNFEHAPFQFGTPATNGHPQASGLMLGGGSSAYPLATAVASASFIKLYCKSTSVVDDNRLAYLYYSAAGIAGGFECLRARTVGAVAGINALRGGSFAGEIDATAASQISGLGCGVEAQFGAGAATRVMTGTIACLNLSSNIGTGNTVPASHAFIRAVNDGAVPFTNLLDISGMSIGTHTNTDLIVSSADKAATHMIKFRGPTGTVMWLLATTNAPS